MSRISTVILAAGASRRLGYNKLCVRIDGEAVIRKTVRLFLAEEAGNVVVVTGFERERIEGELAGLPVSFAHNPRPEDGMSASILAALPVVAGSDLVLIHLGDKPLVRAGITGVLLEAHRDGEGSIIVACHEGVKGHPVLIDMRKHLSAVSGAQGQGGLRDVIAAHAADVGLVEAGEGSVLDLDTEEDLNVLRRRGYTIEKG